MIGFGLLYGVLSLLSVMMNVVNLRPGFVNRLDQGGDLGHLEEAVLNDMTGLLYHIPFAVACVVTAVIFFFPDRVGYAISFLALHCSIVIYWRWDSWSPGTRGTEFVFSNQGPLGANVVTRGLLMLLPWLALWELAVLVKVLLCWRRS
jgi:hypothetical protein